MNILSKIRTLSSLLWSKLGDNYFSIFLGFIFLIGGLILLFENPNRFFLNLSPSLGGAYGYTTNLMLFTIGWFMFLYGILNEIKWLERTNKNSSNQKISIWKKLDLKNKIVIVLSLLFFTSVAVIYTNVDHENLNQKSEEFKEKMKKIEEKLEGLHSY